MKQRLDETECELKKNRDPRRQNQKQIKEVNMPVLKVTMLNNIIGGRRPVMVAWMHTNSRNLANFTRNQEPHNESRIR